MKASNRKCEKLPLPDGVLEKVRRLRQDKTAAEDLLWRFLRNRHCSGLKFRRQHAIRPYIADFYCEELKLVLEIDGRTHDGRVTQDRDRDAYMRSLGLRIIRVTDVQALDNPEGVLLMVAEIAPPEQ